MLKEGLERDQYHLTAAGRNATCLLPLSRIQRPQCSERKGPVAQPCLTLWDRMDCRPPGSSVHGILRQEHWSGLPCPPTGYPPDPGIELEYLTSPALVGRLFTTSVTWEALWYSRSKEGKQ